MSDTGATTLADRIRTALTAAGYAEHDSFTTPRYPDQRPAFLVAEGTGATVITSWRDAPLEARTIEAAGLRVDRRDWDLYVYSDAGTRG